MLSEEQIITTQCTCYPEHEENVLQTIFPYDNKNNKIIELWNYRKVCVGREHYLLPTPLPWVGTSSARPCYSMPHPTCSAPVSTLQVVEHCCNVSNKAFASPC